MSVIKTFAHSLYRVNTEAGAKNRIRVQTPWRRNCTKVETRTIAAYHRRLPGRKEIDRRVSGAFRQALSAGSS
jgi:hypothetical protein